MEPRSEIGEPRTKNRLDTQTVGELVDSYVEREHLRSSDSNDKHIMGSKQELSQIYQNLAQFVRGAKEPHGLFFLRLRDRGKPTPYNEKVTTISYHWEEFAANKRVQQIFGGDQLIKAEERLSYALLEGSLIPESGRGQWEVKANMALFKNSIVAPFVILNKYNPFNYYGQKDFGFKDTQEYVSGFSLERAENLIASSVPGLKELTEMFANTSQPTNEDLVKFRLEVTKIALHYLQNGSLQEKLYIAKDISKMILSRETKDQILQILESKNTPMAVVMEFFTSKISEERATSNDLALNMLFDYLIGHENPKLLSLLKFNEGRLIDHFISKKELSIEDISALSKVFGESQEHIKSAIDFARKQKGLNVEFHLSHHEQSTKGTLSKLIRLATNNDIPSLLEELSKCGYSLSAYQSGMDLDLFDRLLKEKERLLPFIQELHKKGGYRFSDIGNLDRLEELIANRDVLISALLDVTKYTPDFRYYISGRGGEYLNPYKQFISHIDTRSGFSYAPLVAIKRDKGSLPNEFSNPLFDALRHKLLFSRDESLRKRYLDFKKTDTTPETKAAFGKDINTVLEYVQKHPDLEWFYADNAFLGTLTIHPDKAEAMASLPERFPELISLMEEGGPLYTNRENILDSIFSEEDFDRQVQEIVTIFTKKQPYWEMLYFYTEKRLRTRLINAETTYPVADPSSGRRRPFNSLSESDKLRTFKEYLKIVIESSRSEIAKKQADQKNREFLQNKLTLVQGDYIHGTSTDYISEILLNGNLCGEALGQYARADSRPFHVDLGRVAASKFKITSDIIENSISSGYGADGKNGRNGQMFLILKRERTSYERGVDYQVGPEYSLMFTGVPSTAIDAIVLRNPSVALESIKHEIVENGFYLPVYNLNGDLVFTPQDYDEFIKNENIDNVHVEIWDYSLKSGGQKGSNPAAEFTIPEEEGPAKYYVKFKTLENEDQIWNELLADLIYKTLGISVPTTKVVRVNGVYGHASKIIDNAVDGTNGSDDWKKGYLADCLLANWDIISVLDQNTMTNRQTGEVFRIDNGGSLLYRAQGARKEDRDFGERVFEVEEDSKVSPQIIGISSEDLRSQAITIKEGITDEKIDLLVESVRLKKQDRENLKWILRKRRDYILDKFLS